MQARLVCGNVRSPIIEDIWLADFAYPLLIGRGPEADVQLNDRWVSRRHCEVDCRHGRVVVRDLDSRHGTMVNGALTTECLLMPGDCLTVGITTFRLEGPTPELPSHLEAAAAV